MDLREGKWKTFIGGTNQKTFTVFDKQLKYCVYLVFILALIRQKIKSDNPKKLLGVF